MVFLVKKQGPWIHCDIVGGLFYKILSCGLIYKKFRVFPIKVCEPCLSSCKVLVCGRCMDSELIIIIKLPERWLDRGNCHQIA
jgi:hypothetical protein